MATSTAEIKLLTRMKEISEVINDESVTNELMQKLGLLSDEVYTGRPDIFLKNNADTYRVVLNNTLLNWITTESMIKRPQYTYMVQQYPQLPRLITDLNRIKQLRDTHIGQPESFYNYEDISKALKVFGIAEADDLGDLGGLGDFGDLDGYFDEELEGLGEDLDIKFDDYKFDEPQAMDSETQDVLDDYLGGYGEDEQDGEDEQEDGLGVTSEDGYKSDEYYPKVHDQYKNKASNWLSSVWGEMYSNYVNGLEIINGLIVPGEAILSDGEERKYAGILKLSNKTIVEPDIVANGIYEEFYDACVQAGIKMVKSVGDEERAIRKYTYHPAFQKRVVSGSISPKLFKEGWGAYSKRLMEIMDDELRAIAIELDKTGSDEIMYERLSGYITSIAVINHKPGLGMQLRVCCGDTTKTSTVAKIFHSKLVQRERGHRALANGKMVVSEPIISSNGYSFTTAIYTNMEGYQAVPQFMGELLYNMKEGTFKPSVDNMIIGINLNNEIVTAPFTNWMLPIIAGSRSGKGVLTLNMLLNVVSMGTPLFYLDGKPDMAALLWNMNKRHGIDRAVIVDGIGYKGITDIDEKPYSAPYSDIIEEKMREDGTETLLTGNYGFIVYLKTMMTLLMAAEYYKTEMGRPYGNMFVVFDEVYKIIVQQGTTFSQKVTSEENKANMMEKEEKKERKNEINKVKNFVTETLNTYIGNDIGVFGAGIKAVALTQHSMVEKYKVEGISAATQFAKGFLLQRGPKLFGRQMAYSGTYGMHKGKNEETFELYDKYYHFGIGDSNDNTTDSTKTFKPLLVLNESDPMEVIGGDVDGAFTRDMMGRIRKVANEEEFRDKYFRGDPELTKSIGFEGALNQISRLTGENWVEGYRQSMERAYDIADEALRHFGIIGIDGIDSVYDYICSFQLDHLWTWSEIDEAKKKGVPLGEYGDGMEYGDGLGFGEGDSFDFEDGSMEDELDFGDEELDFGEESQEGLGGTGANLGTSLINKYGSQQIDLENSLMKELAEQQRISQEMAGAGEQEETEIQQEDFGDTEQETAEGFRDTEDFGNWDGQLEFEDNMEFDNPEFLDDLPKYQEIPINNQTSYQTGGKTNRQVYINNISKDSDVIGVTRKNSIVASMPENGTAEIISSKFFGGLWGTKWQFQKRWEAVLKSITKVINADLVTRVTITENAMFVNNKHIAMIGILGGIEDIRLEDIVEFPSMFKRFKGIRVLTLDSRIVQRLCETYPEDPVGTLFGASGSLQQLVFLKDAHGSRAEQITRDMYRQGLKDELIRQQTEEAKLKSQIETFAASKNPRLKEKSPGYRSRAWDGARSFGGKSWDGIQANLTKEDPKFMRATAMGIMTLGVLAVGGVLGLIGKAGNMIKYR